MENREFGETTSSRAGRKGEAGGRGEEQREAHRKGESQVGVSEGESHIAVALKV